VPLPENIPYEAVAAPLPQSVFAPRNDTGCILAAMLHYGQRIV
jgi:hypothetical protein